MTCSPCDDKLIAHAPAAMMLEPSLWSSSYKLHDGLACLEDDLLGHALLSQEDDSLGSPKTEIFDQVFAWEFSSLMAKRIILDGSAD